MASRDRTPDTAVTIDSAVIFLAPECGMKYLTREAGKLAAMVQAARELRKEL